MRLRAVMLSIFNEHFDVIYVLQTRYCLLELVIFQNMLCKWKFVCEPCEL